MLLSIREHARRRVERFWMTLAWLMPRSLAKWCFIRVATFNEKGNPGETKVADAHARWELRPT